MNNMKNTILLITLLVLTTGTLWGQTIPTGDEIIKKVNERNEGTFVSQKFSIELTDRRGKKQLRETVSYRKDYENERKTMLFFTSPSNLKGTGFLTYDYHSPTKDDDQWLYLPTLRKTRRISAANRGDYFLGTDLTYEDIKKGSKISSQDYTFKSLREEKLNGKRCYVVEAIPVNEKTGKELGYSKIHFYIDPEVWMTLKSEYWDIAGNPLKTIETLEMELVEGIWTVQKIEAVNHKTEHKSLLRFSNTDYSTGLEDDIFSEQTLLRGL